MSMANVSGSVSKFDPRVQAIHMLRVNVKSLAEEARIIRKEECRAGFEYRWALNIHRRGVLREESRYAQLALAFVRERRYATVEAKVMEFKQVDVARLTKKIQKFARASLNDVAVWASK